MAKLKLRAKDLKKLGYPSGKGMAMAINMMLKHYRKNGKTQVLDILGKVRANPSEYESHEILGRIVEAMRESDDFDKEEIPLEAEVKAYKVYGKQHIDDSAFSQMETAMRLPITVGGALMPDAHHGYGLPIGGVLATDNAVIPYGVGMDIGCRMCLTVYDLNPSYIEQNSYLLKNYLQENTRFGKKIFDNPMDSEVFSRSEFKEIPFVKKLKDKAYKQIGSSGSGNHFVEFGIVDITDETNALGVPRGKYVAILSHSGSRGLGASIARNYTSIAMDKCHLPKEAKNLAWLSLDSEVGMEYWLAMNLAGDYASACHHHIHKRLSRAIGEEPLTMVENHHNFAWKENLADGREVIVHRKGATPAGKGVLGIIPGSMTAPGYIVQGRGEAVSLNSASHGAGRAMSRRKATQSFTNKEFRKYVKKMGVSLIGAGLDESPMAYKNIDEVMKAQQDLVNVLGSFLPKIVRMDRAR